MKAVIFDIQEECTELKRKLSEAGIYVIVPFFGLQVEATLKEALQSLEASAKDCLMLTNQEKHRKIAAGLGFSVAGCIEGHFEVPKTTTLLEAPGEMTINYLNQIYCHEQKLPATIAETERCYIKELTVDDMEALYEILTEEETARYLPAKAGEKEEELEKLISYVSCVYPFFEYGYWGVYLKETGELIGRAGFKEGSYPLEIGYVIKRSLWGRGLATEIVTALMDYASEELDAEEIFAKIDPANTASVQVAKRCGLRIEYM